jgi:hypothetical protein
MSEPWLFAVGGSLVASIATICLSKVIEHYVDRRLKADDLARDLAIDAISTLRHVERVLSELLRAQQRIPTDYTELARYPRHWFLRPLSFSLDKVLGTFSDDELHRTIILYFDAYEDFVGRDAEHKEAFDWLLDHPDLSWDRGDRGSGGRTGEVKEIRIHERLMTIEKGASVLQRDARKMLRNGFAMLRRLLAATDGNFSFQFLRRGPLAAYLAEQYQLTNGDIELRAAYYAVEGPTGPLRQPDGLGVYEWRGDAADHAKRNQRRARIKLRAPDGAGLTVSFPCEVTIPPREPVALPVGWFITETAEDSRNGEAPDPVPMAPLEIPRPLALGCSPRTLDIPLARP